MPLEAPVLDDRTYDDIVAEAQSLIPRYAPEWTNHNRSDPGITLVQLFAFMTEALLYQLNRVPERNHVKFLELLGIQLAPARPAAAELTFALARDDLVTVTVPKGSQIAVANGDEPIVFETDRALIALGARLAAIQTFDGYEFSNQTASAAVVGQYFHPFGLHPEDGSAVLLGFSSPREFTEEQVDLAVLVETEGARTDGRHCDLDIGSVPVPASVVWEYWSGPSGQWRALDLDRDETRAFTRSGHIQFRGPGDRIQRDAIGPVEAQLYWIRARLQRGDYERSPRLDAVLTNTVPASQALTVRDEVLGGSDGSPDQAFDLANRPVVGDLVLEVEERPDVFEQWRQVDDFLESGPDDPDYLLDRSAGRIRFGDGDRGRIPVANPQNPGRNVVARLYRFGGGARGNVGAGTITELQTFVEGVGSVTNLRPAQGGADEERLQEAKDRAPQQLKSKDRAVTSEDYEALARATPGAEVRRAKALPLVHPNFADSRIPGVVSVIVVPESERPDPMPNEATLRAVCAHLNRRRLLAAELHVIPPSYREVKVEVDLIAGGGADLAALKREVEDALTDYFHPLHGGQDGQGWEFGRTIFFSEVYRLILQVQDVDRIDENRLVIHLDGVPQAECRDVPIGEGPAAGRVLLYSSGHEVRASYGRAEP
jgi:predicted phage baseplate assembly protein